MRKYILHYFKTILLNDKKVHNLRKLIVSNSPQFQATNNRDRKCKELASRQGVTPLPVVEKLARVASPEKFPARRLHTSHPRLL